MDFKAINNIYFIGIGGIGMSAIARFFNAKGAKVYGYDKTPTALTKALQAEGIQVSFEDQESAIIKDVDVVVYTPAIPSDSVVLNWYQDNNYKMMKRADILQVITDTMETIAVAGTHGKTTTSTMIAHLLTAAGPGCTAFLGGVSVNQQSNFWTTEYSNIAVVEADEYDRSFLKLSPTVAVLTSMDPDHLDIYGSEEACQNAFIEFTQKIKANGTLIHKQGLKRSKEFGGAQHISYSLQNDLADSYATHITMKDGGYVFDIMNKEWMLQNVHLQIGGMHNVENCIAAITVAKTMNLDDNAIKDAVASFKGVKRRFEYVVKNDQVVYIDDYAHHPEELKGLIRSATTLFPKRKCVIVFQPHLYSRTRDFADDFAAVLSMADEVILMDIYPAREMPIEGVTSAMIAAKMGNPNVTVLNAEGILSYAKSAPLELFITAGAGNIDALVPELGKIIENRYK